MAEMNKKALPLDLGLAIPGTSVTINLTDVVPEGEMHIFTTHMPIGDARDHQCLIGDPQHDWYESGIYMKCSKCGMSYEKPASKDFQL